MGIGTLLLDGIGDTIRVSLTESEVPGMNRSVPQAVRLAHQNEK